MSALVNSYLGTAGLAFSGTVTVGTASFAVKGSSSTQHGFGTSAVSVSGSGFGSVSPSSVSSFPIVGLYWQTSSPSGGTHTTLAVTGDSSALPANLIINGTNQAVGAGTYSSGTNTTTYTSTGTANPFGTDGSSATVTIG